MIAFSVEFPAAMKGLQGRHRKAMRKAMAAALEMWWQERLPGHFQFFAYARYGYAKRMLKYEKRKARRQGHRRPLVWSGELERAMLKRRPNVVFRLGGAQMRFIGLPPWTNMKGQDGTGPDKKAELVAVDGLDRKRFLEVLTAVYGGLMWEAGLKDKRGGARRRAA